MCRHVQLQTLTSIWVWDLNEEFAMNIELNEVMTLDMSDESLELLATGVQGAAMTAWNMGCMN